MVITVAVSTANSFAKRLADNNILEKHMPKARGLFDEFNEILSKMIRSIKEAE